MAPMWFYSDRIRQVVQIDRTTGTNIGNSTLNGGLAAAFDGVTNQAFGACAVANPFGYVGKTFVSGKVIDHFIVYGSNDFGYTTAGAVSVTITMYGKNGAPSSGTDGTAIGSISFTNTANESAGRTIASTDTSNSYTSVWVMINTSATNNSGCAELQMFEIV